MLDQIRDNDIIVVWKLDRLARSTRDLLETMEIIRQAGGKFQSLSEPWANTTTHAGQLIMTIFAGIDAGDVAFKTPGLAAEAIRAPIRYLSNNGYPITRSIVDKRIRLTRAESHAQTRERLLVAARQVFARYGFGGASVDMIAAEAGYSKGAIYSNFETKEAILFELLERYAEEQIADFKAIMQLDPEATRNASNNWLDTMNADMDWDVVTMELQLHARRNPEFAERFYALEERLTSFYADIIAERFARAGRKPPLDTRSLSLAFRTLACGLNLKIPRSMPGRANEAGRIIHELLDLMLEPDGVMSDSAPMKAKGKAPARVTDEKMRTIRGS
jgi:AcrR family transcriptional regulator